MSSEVHIMQTKHFISPSASASFTTNWKLSQKRRMANSCDFFLKITQGANLSGRKPGNQLTAPDKHKNWCGRVLKTALVNSVTEI
jgi:hypothetical protein